MGAEQATAVEGAAGSAAAATGSAGSAAAAAGSEETVVGWADPTTLADEVVVVLAVAAVAVEALRVAVEWEVEGLEGANSGAAGLVAEAAAS